MVSVIAGSSRRRPMNRVTSAGRLSLRPPAGSAVTWPLGSCGQPLHATAIDRPPPVIGIPHVARDVSLTPAADQDRITAQDHGVVSVLPRLRSRPGGGA